jgi:hypothetical protein
VDITHAFFTHLHYDHCMDYGRLVLQRWDQGADKIPDLQVYGPTPIQRMTGQLFGEDGIYGPDIRARIEHQSSIDVLRARGGTVPRKRPAPRVREIHAGDVVEGNGWKVRVGRATHVQPYLECLAFRLDAPDGSLCYTGDSGSSDDIVELAPSDPRTDRARDPGRVRREGRLGRGFDGTHLRRPNDRQHRGLLSELEIYRLRRSQPKLYLKENCSKADSSQLCCSRNCAA